jgi:spectinomycin phosphotransferase
MLEKPNIPDELLRVCLQEHYNITAGEIEFLPLGLDSRAGVYRVVSEAGTTWLLKVKSGLLYEASCFVPHYLAGQAISSVVAPLPAKSNTLWTRLQDWTLLLYPFIEGISGWKTPMSDAAWKETGRTFKQIHQATLPAEFLNSVRKETFNPQEYVDWIGAFERQHLAAPGGSNNQRALYAGWLTHQSSIRTLLNRLKKLAHLLQEQPGPFVICHADLHPGNLIRSQSGRVFVIDWDDVMLAPRERDFLFIKEGSVLGEAPFFQGYGTIEIDRVALTYYRCERVIQDLIECAKNVFFRDDLGEETGNQAVELFCDILGEGGEAETAFTAASHLPSNITRDNN